ncbi:MAG: alpha/beta hydrolase [Gammaproteobacteria bacterium]|jgi:fermentation-respiration switch protein FrsA (DUF1100 family)|nr:MAG: alpha/beta hydrolase [Gammaproteobacteria bacterium]
MKIVLNLLLVLLAAYALVIALIYVFQARMLYQPRLAGGSLDVNPSSAGLAYEDVTLLTSDGLRLHGWFVPAYSARGALLFFHGNAGDISTRLESVALFHQLGLSVFIVDYRGYGRSEGSPSERGTYRDADSAWRHLTEERGIDEDKIVIFGRSLGGAVAAQLASRTAPGALIVESVFTSVPDVAARHYRYLPVGLLSRFRYEAVKYVSLTSAPVLVVHSRDDEIVPFDMGQQLYRAADEPKSFIELRGGHNDAVFQSAAEYTEGLKKFLDRHLPAGS